MKSLFFLTTFFFLFFLSCGTKTTEKEKSEQTAMKAEALSGSDNKIQVLFEKYFIDNPLTEPDYNGEEPEERMPGRAYYKSNLRKGEKLKQGTIYTDEVEYIEYNGDHDYSSIKVKKDNHYVSLLIYDIPTDHLNRGDIISLQWRLAEMTVAGDGSEWIQEWVTAISKKSNGKLSDLLDEERDIDFSFDESISEYFIEKIKYEIFVYLINSTQQSLRNALDNGQDLQIDISEVMLETENRGKVYYHYVEIASSKVSLASLFLTTSYEESDVLYEYDKSNNKLNKFSIY